MKSIIKGTGKYIPEIMIPNSFFSKNTFFHDRPDKKGQVRKKSVEVIIQELEGVTNIQERRYAPLNVTCSDMGTIASEFAIEMWNDDPETIDLIIVAHNAGEQNDGNIDQIPNIASRIKRKLNIKNINCLCYDLPYGCPGWVESLRIADAYIKSGYANRILTIGTEILSRRSDPHDRDCMIFADGAGAVILEGTNVHENVGILSSISYNHASKGDWLKLDKSLNPDYGDELFLRMIGNKIWGYATRKVPEVVKLSLDKIGFDFFNVDKFLFHQANEKMDIAIFHRLCKLYDIPKKDADFSKIPMIISKLGNSSVATIPTMLDMMNRDELTGHSFNNKGTYVFSSVGAGMNCNSVVYRHFK